MSASTISSKLGKELREIEITNVQRDLDMAHQHDKYYVREIKKLQKLRNENETKIGYLNQKLSKLRSLL